MMFKLEIVISELFCHIIQCAKNMGGWLDQTVIWVEYIVMIADDDPQPFFVAISLVSLKRG